MLIVTLHLIFQLNEEVDDIFRCLSENWSTFGVILGLGYDLWGGFGVEFVAWYTHQ